MSKMIKSQKEIDLMAESGEVLGKGLAAVLAAVRPGVTTEELDQLFERTIRALGAEPCFLGYQGYPKSICTSVNDQVVHAIPLESVVLKEGDIVGVDCGVRYKGFCADMARTVAVGSISPEAAKLIRVTKECMNIGIKHLVPGNTLGDVGAAVQEHAEKNGYGVVRVLVGHGIGEEMHEEPSVPNYGRRGTGLRLEEGMVLAIEPMINIGDENVVFEDDGWTVRTADGLLSAHFENTVAIGARGPRILTNLPTGVHA